jgi:hypothetical protein
MYGYPSYIYPSAPSTLIVAPLLYSCHPPPPPYLYPYPPPHITHYVVSDNLGGGENTPHAKEEVSCPMSHNRAKAAVRKAKGKGKANSSSQSEHDSAIGDMLSTLRKMSTIFLKVQLWKQ